jgi:two-component system phosphate regulon sensor histidine kinase PhoR
MNKRVSIHLPQGVAVLVFFVAATLALSTLGILALVFERAGFDILLGILILILGVAVLTGGIMAQASIAQQARMVRLQTDFVSKISHELRTPLASIRMFVDTLRSGEPEPSGDQLECLNVLSAETSRLTRMIERLLAWGRMESGRQVFRMRPELVVTLVGEALAQSEPLLQVVQVQVSVDTPPEPLAVEADREALVEALGNLVTNALKYGASGGVLKLRVRADHGRALVDVEDRGAGIPRSEQKRVFEKFYRGRDQVAAQSKGSGLGLAMAVHVVRAHRGTIHLTSAPGRGSCFTVDLPALPDASAALSVPPASMEAPP